jgi:hypothetical protein
MMYEEEQFNLTTMNSLLEEFIEIYINFNKKNLMMYEMYKSDKSKLKIFKQQYPYFKNSRKYCKIHQLFDYKVFEKFKLNNDFKQYLYQKIGKKIRGIFKHGQCAKTEISCTKIILDIKKGFITIAITKNTLLANKQWTTRCIKLMKKQGLNDLKNQILVISCEFNDLDGNATHCKNLPEAWDKICTNNNNYKVIFVCANQTRVEDVCNLLNKYKQPTFNSIMIKKIVIQYDEAHNKYTGVPSCREYIENMLLYDFVEEFIPITASNNPVYDETNPLWLEINIRKNKLNYLNDDLAKSRIKSDDLNYSSIKDANRIIIDKTYEYTDYDNSISEELFKKHYPKKDYQDFGYINACPVGLCGDERLVLNIGKKILDNQNIQIERQIGEEVEFTNVQIFKRDDPNYHIMITPCRTVITEMLMRYAVVQNYYPVVIGLYGGSINYIYKDYNDGKIKGNKHGSGIEKYADKSKEFNENLYDWIKKKNLLNRPVIIFGNYQNVGESNTFVNSDYGYLRSNILLPGCNLDAEQHYQFLLRCCFLLERFITSEKFRGISKYNIEKFIIGYEQGINDALDYENVNDEIVQELIDNPEDSEFAFEYNYNGSTSSGSNTLGNSKIVSIPVQFKIEDDTCEFVKNMKQIMEKVTRSVEDKEEFIKNLISAIDESSVIKHDKNTDYIINLNEFTLTEFRCYKENLNPDSYRFKGYYDRWELGQRYDNGELEVGECGFYGCLKKHKSSDGHVNNPNTFYILFAYSNSKNTSNSHDNTSAIDNI